MKRKKGFHPSNGLGCGTIVMPEPAWSGTLILFGMTFDLAFAFTSLCMPSFDEFIICSMVPLG